MKSEEELLDTPNKTVSLILFTLLQPAIAGGIPEKEAQDIYNKVLSSIASFEEPDKVFKTVLNDIIDKICIPYAIQTGYILPKNED